MPITQDQARALLTKAKAQKPDLTPEEAKSLLAKANSRLDQPAAPQQQTQTPQRQGWQKVADFLGLGSTASNIGSLGLAGQAGRTQQAGEASGQAFEQAQALTRQAKSLPRGSQEQIKLLDQARAIMQGSEQQMGEFQQDLAQRQAVAGVSEADLGRGQGEFLARRAGGQSAELASWMLPGKMATQGVAAGARIGQAAMRGGVSGALQGAAGATRTAEEAGEAAGQIGVSALLGAGTGAVIQGVLETPQAAREFWNKTAKKLGNKAEDVYMGTLKQNIKDQKFYKQFGGERQVAKEAAANKLPNTKDGLISYLDDYGQEYNKKVASTIAKTEHKGQQIDLDAVKKKAIEIVKKDQGADQTIIDAAENWLKSNDKIYSGKTSLEGANRLRIGLDKTTGGKLAEEISQGPTAIKKALATVLRNEFKTTVPELRPFIRKYQLVAGLSEAMQKEPKIGLTEILGASVTSGGITAFNPLTAAAGALVTKAIRSPGVKRAITTPVIREATRSVAPSVVRSAINASPVVNPMLSALQRAIDKERESKQSTRKLP